MQARELQVVGWYHSHPVSEPKPSQSDILSQKKYQDAVKEIDVNAEPCVGVIVSKFYQHLYLVLTVPVLEGFHVPVCNGGSIGASVVCRPIPDCWHVWFDDPLPTSV